MSVTANLLQHAPKGAANTTPQSAPLPFVALPLPHCKEVGLFDEHALLGLLSPRQALDLAATLIRSVSLLRTGSEAQRDGLCRFDQEFGTPLAQTTPLHNTRPIPLDTEHA